MKLGTRVGVPVAVIAGAAVFVAWASATNRLSLWSARLGAWIRTAFPSDYWSRS